MERGTQAVQSDKPARTSFWRGSLLAAVSLGVIAWLLVQVFAQPTRQDETVCGMAPCVVATLPPAEVVMQVPPGALPVAPLPDAPLPPADAAALPATLPTPAAVEVGPEAPTTLAPTTLAPTTSAPTTTALLPLPEIEVAKRPEPKKPRDILLPGEVMRPERQNAAPPMGASRPKAATPPAVAPLKPLRPAEKTPPKPYTVTTTRPTGAVGIRLGPCGPSAPRYQVDGVEVDAFGRPCGPS